MEFQQLTMNTSETFSDGQAALKELLGETPTLEWMTRLTRTEGGPWKLRVNYPQFDLRDPSIVRVWCSADKPLALFDAPWIAPDQYMGIVTKELDLSQETVDLIRSPRSPEAELRRRRELVRAQGEKIEAEKVAVLARQALERQRAEEERRLDLEFRTQRWDEMPPLSQALIRIALEVEDGRTGVELAAVLRGLVIEAERRKGSLKAPRRIWWEAAS